MPVNVCSRYPPTSQVVDGRLLRMVSPLMLLCTYQGARFFVVVVNLINS